MPDQGRFTASRPSSWGRSTGAVRPLPMVVFQMRSRRLGGGPRPYTRLVSSPRNVDTLTPSPPEPDGRRRVDGHRPGEDDGAERAGPRPWRSGLAAARAGRRPPRRCPGHPAKRPLRQPVPTTTPATTTTTMRAMSVLACVWSLAGASPARLRSRRRGTGAAGVLAGRSRCGKGITGRSRSAPGRAGLRWHFALHGSTLACLRVYIEVRVPRGGGTTDVEAQ